MLSFSVHRWSCNTRAYTSMKSTSQSGYKTTWLGTVATLNNQTRHKPFFFHWHSLSDASALPFNTKWSLMCSIKLWIKHPEGFISVSTYLWWGGNMRDAVEALSCRSSHDATVAHLLDFFSSNTTISLSWSDLLPKMLPFLLRPAC